MNEAFLKVRVLDFEKKYLELEAKSANEKLLRISSVLKIETPKVNHPAIKAFKRAVNAIRFVARLSKVVSQQSDSY